MRGDTKIYEALKQYNINYQYYEHEAVPTIELAKIYKKGIPATHCKNIFLRNHKGSKHYFVVIEQSKNVDIRKLELILKQGKLSFASEKRLKKYLGVMPGAVSPLGLIYDTDKNAKVFIDSSLKDSERLSFHPNVSDASVVVSGIDLERYLKELGIEWEYISLGEFKN